MPARSPEALARKAANRAARYAADPEVRRRSSEKGYLWRYGLTLEEVEALGESCAICGSTADLCVDHDHETGVVRGRLCRVCNRHLGGFRDDLALLRAAVVYLERFTDAD